MALLQQVLDEDGISSRVNTIPVRSEAEAVENRFLGSPSIRVDGEDIEPEARSSTDFGMKCRIYDNEGVPGGVPSKSKIRQAIRRGEKLLPKLRAPKG